MGLELEADIHLGVALGEKLDAIHSVLNRQEPKPNFLPLARGGVVPASGSIALDFGKAPSNKIWNVLSLAAYGSDDHTTVAASNVALYRDESVSLPSLMYTGFTLPGTVTFSKGVIWVFPGDNLMANVVAAGGTQVGANILLAEWNIKDIL